MGADAGKNFAASRGEKQAPKQEPGVVSKWLGGVRETLGVSEADFKFFCDALAAAIPMISVIVLCMMLGEYENYVHSCGLSFSSAHTAGEPGCWTTIDGVYFAVITLTTIGYGDVTPTSDNGRLFCAFLMPYAIFALSMMMSQMHNLREARKMVGRRPVPPLRAAPL